MKYFSWWQNSPLTARRSLLPALKALGKAVDILRETNWRIFAVFNDIINKKGGTIARIKIANDILKKVNPYGT